MIKRERYFLAINSEGDRMALDHGVVPRLVVAHGEVVACGHFDAQPCECVVEHVVHVLIVPAGLVVGEAAQDESLGALKHPVEI